MNQDKIALLTDRGVVRVTGSDALAFLDNLVTNDLEGIVDGEARFAALLTPQGKILFDFFVVRTADGFLLDVARDKAADLVKRLSLYKLRAKVIVEDKSSDYAIAVALNLEPTLRHAVAFSDPRDKSLGARLLVAADSDLSATSKSPQSDYHARRIALGIPESGKDFPLGDTFPHEADMDRLHGVSFTKGCFIGQEVVARMQHKTVVRKRIVQVKSSMPLTSGAEIRVGDAGIGTIGSVAGLAALAMIRLDRAIEALDKGEPVLSTGHLLTIDPPALREFRDETARKTAEKANRI